MIENFQARLNETAQLFGIIIPLGEAQITIPKAKINLNRLEEELRKGNESIPLEISALQDKPAKVVYKNWMSNKP